MGRAGAGSVGDLGPTQVCSTTCVSLRYVGAPPGAVAAYYGWISTVLKTAASTKLANLRLQPTAAGAIMSRRS